MVLYEGGKDVVVAFISSKVWSDSPETGVMLRETWTGFKQTGLKQDSIIRLDKVTTVLKDLIVGELGGLNQELRIEVNKKMQKIMEI